MRILHTSDWHLGKKLFKLDRHEEHSLYLDWLIDVVHTDKIDILLISGDIFDSPSPPHQSLKLFYDFLHRLTRNSQVHVFLIAGNHDSGLLIDSAAHLLHDHRIFVSGRVSQLDQHWHLFKHPSGDLGICLLPFFRSYEIQQESQDLLKGLEKILTCPFEVKHRVLLAHHLVGPFEMTGTEQVIALSGLDSLPITLFDSFSYVALGHIHKHQKIAPHIYYSGSPLAMRFSESSRKILKEIEINEQGLKITEREIPAFRELVQIKTTMTDLKSEIEKIPLSSSHLTSVAEVIVKLPSPQPGLIDEAKELLKKKNIELIAFIPEFEQEIVERKNLRDLYELSETELLREFYRKKFPDSQDLPQELVNEFQQLLERERDEIS